jgi:hypothetical protein
MDSYQPIYDAARQAIRDRASDAIESATRAAVGDPSIAIRDAVTNAVQGMEHVVREALQCAAAEAIAETHARRRERIATAVLGHLAPNPESRITKDVEIAVAYADALMAALDAPAAAPVAAAPAPQPTNDGLPY